MKFDYSKLRGRIVEKFGSMTNFAEALGVSKVTISNKLCSEKGLSHGVILRWAALLEIPTEEIGVYFFTPKVRKAEQTTN